MIAKSIKHFSGVEICFGQNKWYIWMYFKVQQQNSIPDINSVTWLKTWQLNSTETLSIYNVHHVNLTYLLKQTVSLQFRGPTMGTYAIYETHYKRKSHKISFFYFTHPFSNRFQILISERRLCPKFHNDWTAKTISFKGANGLSQNLHFGGILFIATAPD